MKVLGLNDFDAMEMDAPRSVPIYAGQTNAECRLTALTNFHIHIADAVEFSASVNETNLTRSETRQTRHERLSPEGLLLLRWNY